MVKLTCLLKRKPGLTPEEFHAYWRNHHGPLMAATQSGSHVFRYEQNPKPLSSYQGDADDGYDGVTVQWFETMDDYEASIGAPDVGEVMADVAKFLAVDHLEFVVTENPFVVIDGPVPPGA
jgi:uncharacterized protein (TIGR02118 family)